MRQAKPKPNISKDNGVSGQHYPVIISGSQALTNSAQFASMVASSSVLHTSAPGIDEHPFNVNILLTSISLSPKTCTWKMQMQTTTLRKGEEPERMVRVSLPICYQEGRIEWRTILQIILLFS